MNPPESLIQYNPPIEKNQFVSEIVDAKQNKEIFRKTLKSGCVSEMSSRPNLETLLNFAIPPRESESEGQVFLQTASQTPSNREDVINLQKLLDERLAVRQAKESGICPIREELHDECFDEIIRQVTIDCAERGLLLARVRDEIKMTMSAYQTLYKGAVSFGVRKQMQTEKGKGELTAQLSDLRKKKAELEKARDDLLRRRKVVEVGIEERKIAEKNKKKTEMEFLEFQNQHLRQAFQSIELAKQ